MAYSNIPYIQLPQINTQGPDIIGSMATLEGIRASRQRQGLAEIASQRQGEELDLHKQKNTQDMEMSRTNAIVSIMSHALSAAALNETEDGANATLKKFEEIGKRIDPNFSVEGIQIKRKGRDLKVRLKDGTELSGTDANFAAFEKMVGDNPSLVTQNPDPSSIIEVARRTGVSILSPDESKQSFEKQAFAEWKKENPSGTMTDFLKFKKSETTIHTPNFEEQTFAEWKTQPGNEKKTRMDFLKEKESGKVLARTGGVELSPEAMKIEGYKFFKTGKMPAMGMGSSPTRVQIINEAALAAKEEGVDPKDVPAIQAEYGAIVKTYEAVKKPLANFTAFETALQKNADYALELSAENYRTSMPSVNRVMNAIKTGTGDEKIVKFGAAIYAAAMEYEKIRTAGTNITSAELSIGAQKKAEEIMNKAQTHGQLKAVIEAMKVDAENVVGSRKEQLDTLGAELRKLNGTMGMKESAKPKGGKFSLDAETAKGYLDKAGGDKAKARELAKADGWKF